MGGTHQGWQQTPPTEEPQKGKQLMNTGQGSNSSCRMSTTSLCTLMDQWRRIGESWTGAGWVLYWKGMARRVGVKAWGDMLKSTILKCWGSVIYWDLQYVSSSKYIRLICLEWANSLYLLIQIFIQYGTELDMLRLFSIFFKRLVYSWSHTSLIPDSLLLVCYFSSGLNS